MGAAHRCRHVHALAILLCATTVAHGKSIVAVAPMRGNDHARIEQTVVQALKPRAIVLSPTRYALVAKGLFAEGPSPEDISAVARELGAAWVVTGALKVDGSRWSLGLSLRDGKTGKSRVKLRYTLGVPRVSPAVLKRVRMEIAAAYLDMLAAPPPADDEQPDDRPRNNGGRADRNTGDDDEAPPARPGEGGRRKKQPAQTADTGKTDDAALDAAVETPQPKPEPKKKVQADPTKRPPWARWFDLQIGVSVSSRTFALDPAADGKFTSGVVGGFHLDGTVYPLAFTWKHAYGLFAGIGLGLTLDKPIWPSSTAVNDPTQVFPTSELHVEGGLRWKITLYKPMPRPQLSLIVEGGFHDFSFAKGADGSDIVGVPDVHYTYASLGGGLTIHFADWSWMWLQFVYHAVTNAGPIQTPTEYGLAATNGFRFSGGLDFLVYKGIKLGLQGYYERFAIRFGYDPQNTKKIADSATDEYFGGMLVLGYVL